MNYYAYLSSQDDATGQFQGSNSGHRSPKKKNRIRLESTEEEDTTSRSRTPSPSSSQPSPPHEIKVRQISQGVEDISWRRKEMTAAAAAFAEKNETAESDALDPVTPIAVPEEVPTAPASPVDIALTEVSSDSSMKKLHQRSTSSASGSDSGDQDKSLKRKLADRGASHGPENGNAAKATDDDDASKRARDADDDLQVKKRPTPPSTPEATNTPDEKKRPTPPATPPSDSDELSKPAEHLKRPRDDADQDANPRQTKKPSPPPEKTLREDQSATTPRLVRVI
jgi:Ran-binding protein 3